MKKILITPLDWGLGHATRCIPIIQFLLSKGCYVYIGSSGSALALLKSEFPALTFFELTAYHPVYPDKGSMVWKMNLQLPKFLSAILKEHRQVKHIVNQHGIDVVISDNRYGCWSNKIPSVFITHQSNIIMPERFGWLRGAVRNINQRFINNFDYCWIPDFPDEHSLAGELISFGKIKVKAKVAYIGALSRFSRERGEVTLGVLAICSGPEPQRSIFEKIVYTQLVASSVRFVLVRGVVEEEQQVNHEANGTIINFVTTGALQTLIQSAAFVIARSGYSTIMDLRTMGKKAIFIPTPGQTEQAYLAKRLKEKRIAFYMLQKDFNLQTALQEATNYSGFTYEERKNDLLPEVLNRLLNGVSNEV